MFDTKLVSAKTSSVTSKISRIGWYTWPYFPLIAALMLALLLRVILIIHAGGVMDGDEALVGIQAEHILHGERPIYFYGQAVMGSLEAYLIVSVWTVSLARAASRTNNNSSQFVSPSSSWIDFPDTILS